MIAPIIVYNCEGLPQCGPTLYWAAISWRTFFLKANLRQSGHIYNSTIL
jgi:hypothetical protein